MRSMCCWRSRLIKLIVVVVVELRINNDYERNGGSGGGGTEGVGATVLCSRCIAPPVFQQTRNSNPLKV